MPFIKQVSIKAGNKKNAALRKLGEMINQAAELAETQPEDNEMFKGCFMELTAMEYEQQDRIDKLCEKLGVDDV